MAKYPLPAATATPLLSSPLRFQVLLFSHGLVGSTAGYSSTCIEAASHGFIVIAPEHTDGSAIISYVGSDRQRLRYTYYSADTHRMTEGQFRKNQIQVRIDDLSSLIEQLHLLHSGEAQLIPLATNAPPPDLTGRLSLDTLLLAGHSFGAATVLQFANHVSSTHILLLDPWLLPLQKEGVAACRVGDARVLVIHQELSKMTQSRSLLTNLPPCKPDALMLAVEIMGGRHNNSSDFPLRMPRWVAISSGMTSRGSDPLHLLQVQNRAVAAFLSDNHEWKEFVNRVKKGEEQGLALAST